MEPIYTAEVTSIGGRNGQVKSSTGSLNLEVRSPKVQGGADDSHANPEQLFAAGYAACLGGAINYAGLLRKLRINTEINIKVSLYKRDDVEVGFKLGVEIDVKIPDVDQQTAEELVKEGHTICPYSYSIRNNVEVVTKVRVS
ncbi:MAG: Ohr family peroxiredoxin [Bacteroidales bacterium]|jgi:Ohr subfamily peroxiredoxin|nr:Ohr family peroxiredoxin [Bacteroidales bacterium]